MTWRRLLSLLAVIAACATSCSSSSVATSVADPATTASVAATAPPEPAAVHVTPTGPVVVDNDDATDSSTGADEEPLPSAELVVEPAVEPVIYDGSFSSSILPILEAKCSSCHYDGGPGAFHWNLRTAQDVADTYLLMEHVITTNLMPPWPASDLSVAFAGDRSLRPDQIQAIVSWIDDDAPIDVDPSTSIDPASGLVRLENPDIVTTPLAPYAGDASLRDEHRCLIYDMQLPEGGWITGFEFLPDQKAVVHHAVGYVMPEYFRPQIESLEAEDGRPGWSCAGAVGLGGRPPLLTWAPGQGPVHFAEGTGLWVQPGSFIVVQIHYHYDGEAPLDNTSLALAVEPPAADVHSLSLRPILAPVEIPCATWESGPLCDRDAAFADAVDRFGSTGVFSSVNSRCGVTPADFAQFTDGVVESTCTERLGQIGEIQGVFMHMHEIATWTRLTLNKGKPDERILVDIPTWDFDWQYTYVPAQPITIGYNDTVTLECAWDRRLRNPDLEPAWILWTEGTDDEMCIAYMTLR